MQSSKQQHLFKIECKVYIYIHMSAILSEKRLRWLGHVRRMGPGRIPRDLLYGELAEGSRLIGHPRLRYKDICKKDMKLSDINIGRWESRAEDRSAWHFVVRQGVQKAEETRIKNLATKRVKRKEKQLQPQLASSSFICRKCSRDCIQVLGFIATREGADRWNFIKLEATPSSPGDGRMPKIYIYIRGGTVHVFVPNSHGTGISVRCMMPHDEYRQFTPNPEGGAAAMQRCLITASRRTANANGDTEVGALMFGSLYFILIKYQLCCQVSNAGTDVCVHARVCECVTRSLQLFPYTSRINFKHVLSY